MKRFFFAIAVAMIALVGLSANQCTNEQPSQPPQQTPPAEQNPPQQ